MGVSKATNGFFINWPNKASDASLEAAEFCEKRKTKVNNKNLKIRKAN